MEDSTPKVRQPRTTKNLREETGSGIINGAELFVLDDSMSLVKGKIKSVFFFFQRQPAYGCNDLNTPYLHPGLWTALTR